MQLNIESKSTNLNKNILLNTSEEFGYIVLILKNEDNSYVTTVSYTHLIVKAIKCINFLIIELSLKLFIAINWIKIKYIHFLNLKLKNMSKKIT